MNVRVFENSRELGNAAADRACEVVSRAISERGYASIVVATGKSQIEFLNALVERPVDWSKAAVYQLDEYIGLPKHHPASLSEFIRVHLLSRIRPRNAYLLDEVVPVPPEIDVAFVGVGENGHLAFNDPPADFESDEPYLIVELDERCRRQQVGEGWFARIGDVPKNARSMSIRQIMKAREILCIVPEGRKAEAVRDCFGGAISPLHPASILQAHDHATVFLDRDSATLVTAS